MKDFRQLKVCGKAHEMTLFLYKLTVGFPKHELFERERQPNRDSD